MKILLVIDSSPHSMAAVDLLTRMTWPAGTCVDLFVLVPECVPGSSFPPGVRDAMTEMLELARWRDWAAVKMLATQVTGQLQARHLKVETELGEGQPAKVALIRATDLAADLIVIGAKGVGLSDKIQLDPAVYNLVEEAKCSVLVARPSAPVQPLNTILAVDGSPQAWRSVEFLCELAPSNWAKITVVNVSEEMVRIPAVRKPTHPYPGLGVWPSVQLLLPDPLDSCTPEAYISDVVGYLHMYGIQGWGLTCFGHPVDEILSVEKQRDAALIVIGAGGQTRSGSLRLGSVVQQVVKEAAGSVLVVR
jgi:nucleotide-binding universal stress UspA family protein